MSKRVLVVCIGNRLVGDDGVGPHVFDVLERDGVPDSVSLRLHETRGIALLDDLAGQDLLIAVDAVQLGKPPGTLHIRRGDRLGTGRRMPVTSHDVSLFETLAVCEVLYPEKLPASVLLIGVEGRDFNQLGASLSSAVRNAIPAVVRAVKAELDGC